MVAQDSGGLPRTRLPHSTQRGMPSEYRQQSNCMDALMSIFRDLTQPHAGKQRPVKSSSEAAPDICREWGAADICRSC